MAMTDTRPDTGATSGTAATAPTDGELVLGTADHKTIGRLWIAVSSLYVLVALIVAAAAGFERIDLGSFDLVDDAEMYGQLWSLGRVTLLVLGIVPLLIGLATYVVPLQVGASTLAFPRGAAAAFWCWLVAGALLVASYVMNGGPGGGRQDFTSLWAASYIAVLLSLLWALVCVLTTIHGLRTVGMTLDRTPISTWSFFVFGTVGLATLSVMAAELVVSYVRIRYGDLDSAQSRLALTGVTDQISLAPGVFWLGIPVLGLGAEMMATHAEAPSRQHRLMMGLLAVFGVLSFAGHHLGFMTLRTDNPLDNALLVIQVLVLGLLILALLGLGADSVRRGRFRVRTPMVAALVGGALLALAALVAVLSQVEPILEFIEDLFNQGIDVPQWLQLNETTLQDGVRVLVVGSALVAAVGALHHWGHKIYGRSLADGLGLLAVAALAGGAALWGIADVVTGMLGQGREPIPAAEVRDGVEILNAVAVAGAALMALGALLVVVNVVISTLAHRGSTTEPWRGLTLEWATPSPPPLGNFPEPPVVRSATPLADPLPAQEVR